MREEEHSTGEPWPYLCTVRLTQSPEVIEKDGRPEWIRTIDLFRVKEAL